MCGFFPIPHFICPTLSFRKCLWLSLVCCVASQCWSFPWLLAPAAAAAALIPTMIVFVLFHLVSCPFFHLILVENSQVQFSSHWVPSLGRPSLATGKPLEESPLLLCQSGGGDPREGNPSEQQSDLPGQRVHFTASSLLEWRMVLLLRSSEAGCGYFCFQSHSRWKKTPCGLPEISFYLKWPFNHLGHPEDHAGLLHTRKHGEVRWAMPRNPCFVDNQARVTGDCASNCGGAWEDCLTMTARVGSAIPHSLLVTSSKEPEYGFNEGHPHLLVTVKKDLLRDKWELAVFVRQPKATFNQK